MQVQNFSWQIISADWTRIKWTDWINYTFVVHIAILMNDRYTFSFNLRSENLVVDQDNILLLMIFFFSHQLSAWKCIDNVIGSQPFVTYTHLTGPISFLADFRFSLMWTWQNDIKQQVE